MSQKIRSFARRLGAAVRVAAGSAGGVEAEPDAPAGAAKKVSTARRADRDAALRSGVIGQRVAVQVELDAARLASDAGEKALAQILSDSDPGVRARAIGAIVAFSGPYATRLLRAMMVDPDATVRRLAVAAAPRVEGSDVVLSLIVALGDPDATVRKASAHAIASIIGEPVALDPRDWNVSLARLGELEEWWKERRRAELAAELIQESSAKSIR